MNRLFSLVLFSLYFFVFILKMIFERFVTIWCVCTWNAGVSSSCPLAFYFFFFSFVLFRCTGNWLQSNRVWYICACVCLFILTLARVYMFPAIEMYVRIERKQQCSALFHPSLNNNNNSHLYTTNIVSISIEKFQEFCCHSLFSIAISLFDIFFVVVAVLC